MTTPTILITGANTGIGFASAKKIAEQNARVVLACRNMDNAREAQVKIQQVAKHPVEIVQLDLNSLEKTREASLEIAARFGVIDVLINNAGVLCTQLEFTEDKIEKMFGVNYLGHFLLTHRLLPNLQAANHARIIHLASIGHWFSGYFDIQNFAQTKNNTPQNQFKGLAFYGQSKLANLMFSHKLAKVLAANPNTQHITSNAVHPGAVDSSLYQEYPKFLYRAMKPFLIRDNKPSNLITQMAVDTAWATKNGHYASAQLPNFQSRYAKNVLLADKLYNDSMAMVAPFL